MKKNKETNQVLLQKIEFNNIKEIDINKGLNDKQIKENQAKYGKNLIPEKKPKSLFMNIIDQLKDPLVFLLLIVVIISFSITLYSYVNNLIDSKEQVVAFAEPLVILFIIVLNVIFKLMQEIKTKKAISSLKNMNFSVVKVIRNNQEQVIETSEILVGDILLLELGNVVPADGLVLEQSKLKVQEAMLTGESESVYKKNFSFKNEAEFSQNEYFLFSGSTITSGKCKLLVTAIGKDTKLGNIASLISNTKEVLSPMQQKIIKLSKFIGIFATILSLIFFFSLIFIKEQGNFANWQTALIISLTIAIGVIPEGLVPLVTISLIIGVKKLAKQNVLVKDITSIETLGNVSVICTDKTGTLTENKMKLIDTFIYQVNQEKFWTLASLCTDAIFDSENLENKSIGDPEEILILEHSQQLGINKNFLMNSFPRIFEIPFNSQRKMMSVVNKIYNKFVLIAKGAPEIILSKSINVNADILKTYEEFNEQGYRIFALAYKEILGEIDEQKLENEEQNLYFAGFIIMQDNPRQGIKNVIEKLHNANIQTVMITGDHAKTANSIARQINLITSEQQSLSKEQWNALNEEKWSKNIENYRVYSRTTPEDKIKIVSAWQDKKHIVAMLGDGVNDAPALKKSNVGFAMGITGSDVTKQVSNVVLADDNFTTTYTAIKNGRNVINNIKILLIYLLIANLCALLISFFGLFIFKENIFSALQILWINVVSETVGGIAIGLSNISKPVMNKTFLENNKSLFNKEIIFKILILSILITTITLISYFLGKEFIANTLLTEEQQAIFASSTSFITISIALSLNSFILVVNKPLMLEKWSKSKYLNIGFLLSLLSIIFISFTPGLNTIFHMNFFFELQSNNDDIATKTIILSIFFGFLIFILDQIWKICFFIIEKRKKLV
ncbi:cation-translocating P-type ATPase [Mycoplasma sp. 1654_15]|uniref:cation-translocating P-type ATPase n=1 Tax=Mycoplasma sp. 1654_15 TaxID=2725994 RepID=UPI001449DC54|nr:cation-translocating P-type ATPase [Mycoplasma sp. 1654_15]QJB71343.1 cation-translocating P-type ATPase [Mycoplasma sp. 1654_15]